MSPGVPTKLIGACCGLCAFALAIVAGLSAGNPADTILLRAIVALVAGQIVGLVCGAVAERTVGDAMDRYRASRPIPGLRARSGEPSRTSPTTPATPGAGAPAPST